MPSARVIAAAASAAALLLGGCGGSEEASTQADPTSIADLDVAAISPARTPFCDQVPGGAVRAALGGEPTSDGTWGIGDPAPGRFADVADELGCSWAGPDGSVARAWVFARPVNGAFAEAVTRDGARRRGCSSPGRAAFGMPSLTQVCAERGGATRVRHAGLFGSTWLSCELTVRGGAPETRARADTWCAAVATALG